MFEATMSSAAHMTSAFSALKDFGANLINMNVFDGGMYVQGAEESGVAIAAVRFDRPAFQNFHCSEPCTLGVNVAALLKVLGVIKADETLHMKADGTAPDTLLLLWKGCGTEGSFVFNLMNISAELLTIPELPQSASTLCMPSEDLSRIVSDVAGFGNTVAIHVDKGASAVHFVAEGDEGYFSVNNGSKVRVRASQTMVVAFSAKMLRNSAKGLVAKNVELSFDDKSPLLLEFCLPGEAGYVRFYYAPVVED